MAGPVICASSQQWVPDFSPNTMLLDSCDAVNMIDQLCLRHDQQLEYAKEYNSIIPEPLGSRLKSRFASCHLAMSPPATIDNFAYVVFRQHHGARLSCGSTSILYRELVSQDTLMHLCCTRRLTTGIKVMHHLHMLYVSGVQSDTALQTCPSQRHPLFHQKIEQHHAFVFNSTGTKAGGQGQQEMT